MARHLVFSEHALDRMLQWRVGVGDVESAPDDGETIEEYEDGARLVLGRSGIRPLHVVVRNDPSSEEEFVITVYEPQTDRWDAGFTRRTR